MTALQVALALSCLFAWSSHGASSTSSQTQAPPTSGPKKAPTASGPSAMSVPVAEPFDVHLQLDSAAPAPGSEVELLEGVELWFSEAPMDGSVRVRLVDAENRAAASETTVDPDDDQHFTMKLADPATPGEYRIFWRAMARDSHVVTGDFGLSVVGAPSVPSRDEKS